MTVLIINPNSTDAMTRAMIAAARQVEPGLEFEGWTSRNGPASIQGADDGEAASGPLLDLVDKAAHAKGIIIGCFDDTALGQAARRVDCPVFGIGQAAFHFCALRQWRFSVVTTLPVSVPVIEENLVRYGLAPFCAKVHASDVSVLALESDPDAAIGPIVETARKAQSADGIDAVILGCAGMVHVVHAVRHAINIPVIDPVEAAATGMGWLIRL
ncbi:MAG: aspartate/glutamate racemase family protein [Pseudomonadota bacterium]